MAEYLDREALEIELNHRLNFLMAENGEYDHYTSGFDEAVTRVENFQSADVAPVKHGRIIESIENGKMKRVFSCCGEDFTKLTMWLRPNYCPNCGCKMDGGTNE